MVGNCIFIMPFFIDPMVMVWFLTIPITIVAFLVSDYSPLNIKSNVTAAGHGLGLFYYAGIWTLLIFLFPDKLWLVSVAIATMVYGDGFAAIIGQKYGRHKYNLTGDVKSIEGSLAMFLTTFITMSFVFVFYQGIGYPTPSYNLLLTFVVSLIATFIEASTPKGLDNITASGITAILYYIGLVVF